MAHSQCKQLREYTLDTPTWPWEQVRRSIIHVLLPIKYGDVEGCFVTIETDRFKYVLGCVVNEIECLSNPILWVFFGFFFLLIYNVYICDARRSLDLEKKNLLFHQSLISQAKCECEVSICQCGLYRIRIPLWKWPIRWSHETPNVSEFLNIQEPEASVWVGCFGGFYLNPLPFVWHDEQMSRTFWRVGFLFGLFLLIWNNFFNHYVKTDIVLCHCQFV